MTLIQLYVKGEAQISQGHQYLMVVSDEIDANGNWIPSHVETFKGDRDLLHRLESFRKSERSFVIRASNGFQRFAKKLSLPLQFGEWGLLRAQ